MLTGLLLMAATGPGGVNWFMINGRRRFINVTWFHKSFNICVPPSHQVVDGLTSLPLQSGGRWVEGRG